MLDSLRQDKGLKRLEALIPYSRDRLRLVGGCVRDSLLQVPCQDLDLATTYTPQDLLHILEPSIPVRTHGIAFGTLMAIIDGRSYEITSCRQDIETDGRWAKVHFTQEWRKDAMRRDFTFNAMYLSLEGDFFDYFEGLNDLRKGNVRFIGDPIQRLAEDRLRLLRYYRFWTRFGQRAPDPHLHALFTSVAKELKHLSKDRIRHELLHIAAAPFSQWQCVLTDFNEITLFESLFSKPPLTDALTQKDLSPLGRLWSLYRHDLEILTFHLNLSKEQKKYILFLDTAYGISQTSAIEVLTRYGPNVFKDWKILTDQDPDLWPLVLPDFPLTSYELMALGYTGKTLGIALKETYNWWLLHEGKKNKDACLSYLFSLGFLKA